MTSAEFKLAIRQMGHMLRHFDLVLAVVLGEWAASVRRSAGKPDLQADHRLQGFHRKLDEGMPR